MMLCASFDSYQHPPISKPHTNDGRNKTVSKIDWAKSL